MTDTWQTLKSELTEALRDATQLPADARTEVRADLDALRNLVLNHREPRICLVGKRDVGLHEVMDAIGMVSDWDDVRERLGRGRWYEHTSDRGLLQIADLRDDAAPNLRALEYMQPDAIVAVARSADEAVDGVAGAIVDAMELSDDVWGVYPAGIAAVFRSSEGRNAGDFKTMQAFKDALVARGLARDWIDVVSVARPPGLPQMLLQHVPSEARFGLARLTDNTEAKRELAFELIQLASSLNAAIATIPIPLASIFPITSVQIAMLSGIAYVSGRPVNVRGIGEFAAAVGLNVGAGIAFRELARALVQWIPVAGPVVSASIAAGATLTLGKAAVRYYLD